MGLTCWSILCFAQPNNPYDQKGIDYATSVSIVSADFDAGKVKEFNTETLNKYSKMVPLQNQVSMDMVAGITKTLKAPNFSFTGFVNGSSLSAFAKQIVPQLLNVKKVSQDEFRKYLAAKVDEIKTAKIDNPERELLLSLTAISYHVHAAGYGRSRGCQIQTPTYSGPAEPETCMVMGATVGGMIGFSLCGFFCGLGGAIIGGVVGALS